MMSRLTKVLADHEANITHVDIHIGAATSGIYFEFTIDEDRMPEVLIGLRAIAGVKEAQETPSSGRIYGKRIIVMGGRGPGWSSRDGCRLGSRPAQYSRRTDFD